MWRLRRIRRFLDMDMYDLEDGDDDDLEATSIKQEASSDSPEQGDPTQFGNNFTSGVDIVCPPTSRALDIQARWAVDSTDLDKFGGKNGAILHLLNKTTENCATKSSCSPDDQMSRMFMSGSACEVKTECQFRNLNSIVTEFEENSEVHNLVPIVDDNCEEFNENNQRTEHCGSFLETGRRISPEQKKQEMNSGIEKDIKCQFCPQTFSPSKGVSGLLLHLDLVHNHGRLTCCICTGLFASEESLAHHIDTFHKETKPNSTLLHRKKHLDKSDSFPNSIRYKKNFHKKEVFRCAICSKDFLHKKVLNNHRYRVHGLHLIKEETSSSSFTTPEIVEEPQNNILSLAKTFDCQQCSTQFATNFELKRHCIFDHQKILWNMGEKIVPAYLCDKCPKVFLSVSKLLKHQSHECLKSEKEQFINEKCLKVSSRKSSLDSHKVKCDEVTSFKCNICDKVFKLKRYLTSHYDRIHNPVKKFACHICNEVFGYKLKLDDHINRVHIQKRFACDRCPRVFKNKKYLNDHICKSHISSDVLGDDSPDECSEKPPDVQKPSEYICDKCGRVFTQQKYLDLHYIRLHTTKRYSCEECPEAFSNYSSFVEHKKIYHKHTHHSCDKCSKVFAKKGLLSAHIKRVHNTFKKFICHHCSAAFTYRNLLNIHLNNVHNYRKFQCQECLKFFSQSGALHIHIRRVHSKTRNFQCDQCDKVFMTSADLTKHHDGVHKKLQHHCPQCAKIYHYKSGLKRHMYSAHNIKLSFQGSILHCSTAPTGWKHL